MRFRVSIRPIVAVLALSLTLTSCALKGNARHIAVVGNVAVAESLLAIQATADDLRAKSQITVEQRQALGKVLLPALEGGQQLARLTATWPEGKPAPPELVALVPQLRALVDHVLAQWPESPGKAALVTKLSIAQNAALALLLIFAQ